MEKQRERMQARRKRLKEAKAETKKYGSGGKKAVTRDPSKDKSRRNIKRDNLLKTPPPPLPPISGPKPKVQPKAQPKAPVQAEKKSSTKKAKPPATDSNIMSSSSRYTGNNLRKPLTKADMPYAGEFPGTPKKEAAPSTGTSRSRSRGEAARRNRQIAKDKISKPKKGDKKTVTIGNQKVVMMYNGKKWVPAK